MKRDGHQRLPPNTEDITVPFFSPSSTHRNANWRCPALNKSNISNCRGKMAQTKEDAISSTARESQMTDICNGNFPKGGRPSEALRSWSLVTSCQKLPGGNGGNKQLRHFGQRCKEIPPAKITQQGFPSKDVFLFWAKKAGDGNEVAPWRSGSPKAHQVQEMMDQRCEEQEAEDSKGRCWSPPNSPETTQRKRRRDLFPDSEVFRQLDAHVLHVSEQLKTNQESLSVQTIVPLITKGANSQLEKARAIWIWLCHNIKYDVNGFLGFSEKIHTPEQVLRTGRGVCSGYAHLYRDMCREAGLTCAEVSGYGRGAGYSQGQSCLQKKSDHMWNAVQLGGQWFLLDVCWGAGLVDVEKRLFIPRHEDFFFLTDPEDFVESHWPDDPKWQLTQPPVPLQVFEGRVFKTPEFFKLQLALLSPDTSRLKTDQGEATISLASARTTEFTYQLLKLCHDDNSKEDMGKTHGMLTMSDKKMVLKVFPPTEGLFEVQIFARPSDSPEPCTWVCSHQIECLEPHRQEGLPENPFAFWGLHPKAREFGIEECNWEEDLIVATAGALKLALQTQRPLLATYELVHPEMDTSLSRKCLASQVEEQKLSCHVLCPFVGHYRLSVFVKELDEDKFKNAANFLIRCPSPINHNELFPSGLSAHCGAGISSQWRGLSNPSHTAPIINTKKGRCTVTFRTQPGFEVTTTLGKDKITRKTYPMERFVLVTHLENKVSVSILLPESGVFRLSLYGRDAENKEFVHVCDYIIRCFTNPQWLPFPRVYSLWRKGCVLLEPRSGVLQEKSWVRFRIKMPEACSAHIVGPSRWELQLGQNKVWEGEVYTGLAATMLKVAIKFSLDSPSMDVILSFDVEGNSSILSDASG
ncbi:kyphoscoliosis peptidase-like [Zootoca vivipara]|uniref:kyphoscoliosis peptidase-like n=1 Tax=Zootoca vivipara TaxID=8524 RepID=UPI00293BCE64|nr:kyphoscoliosis peptidase-like [Zootoca vivipara]